MKSTQAEVTKKASTAFLASLCIEQQSQGV